MDTKKRKVIKKTDVAKKTLKGKCPEGEKWMPVNRVSFNNWINTHFREFLSDGTKKNTVRSSGQPGLFLHQGLVQKFLSPTSPYRGLLLYHGLGSGKTCSSIAIAEGLKHHMKVVIMLPASLRPNYVAELKFCGDDRYYLGQHWTFESCSVSSRKGKLLQETHHIPAKVFRKCRGCWISDRSLGSGNGNFKSLSSEQQAQIHYQIDAMMESNYSFIHYNGIRKEHCARWEDESINPFSNRLIIIDEVHNFISRAVGSGDTGQRLYRLLLQAENSRFVLLSGTPMINYPHESALLLNLLRGKMKTYQFNLRSKTTRGQWNDEKMTSVLQKIPMIDYFRIDAQNQSVMVSRLPKGFVKCDGIHSDEIVLGDGNSGDDKSFSDSLRHRLEESGYTISSKGPLKSSDFLAYPDDRESFEAMFLKGGQLNNVELLRSRMSGMISYYQGAKDELFPKSYMMMPDSSGRIRPLSQREAYKRGNFIIPVDMSDYQFKMYEEIRKMERDLDTSNRRKAQSKGKSSNEVFSSYYRVFSRCYCNFVFPEGLDRPIPGNSKLTVEEAENLDEFEDVVDKTVKLGVQKQRRREEYNRQKTHVLTALMDHRDRYLRINSLNDQVEGLAKYSPKYTKIIQNLSHCGGEAGGSAFVYSQFREMEGIGLLSKALEANGYAPFRINQDPVNGEWTLDVREEEKSLPKYCFYTGWESPELKEITKSIFNNEFEKLSESLRDSLLKLNPQGNLRGGIIKVFLATSSAAEGITLCNVRQVHIMEPYWNPVRTEQVIGRAVRIGSHIGLPLEDRNVNIFSYVSVMTKSQLEPQSSFTIRKKDNSLTSDQYLYQVSESKRAIMQGIVSLFRESAIDCTLNAADNEPVECVKFPDSRTRNFSFSPDIYRSTGLKGKKPLTKSKRVEPKLKLKSEDEDKTKKITWTAQPFTHPNGNRYILNKTSLESTGTSDIYDYTSYNNHIKKGSDLIRVGRLTLRPKKIEFF